MDSTRGVAWKILDKYFETNKHFVTKHHLDSYSEFIHKSIPMTIQTMNPFVIIKYKPDRSVRHRIEVFVGGKDGQDIRFKTPDFFPNEARMKNLTYSADLVANIIVRYMIGEDSVHEVVIKDVFLSKIPIMLQSDLCNLHNMSLSEMREHGECPYDQGGYFVVNGKEKVIIAQERNVTNKVFVKRSADEKYKFSAFVRCTSEKASVFPKTAYFYVLSKEVAKAPIKGGKTKELKITMGQRENAIVVAVPHIKTQVPLFLLFRALGIESDKMILEYIIKDVEDPVNRKALEFMFASIVDSNYIYTQEQAMAFLDSHTNFTENAEDARYILLKHLFPNIEPNLNSKALFLGYIVNQIVRVAIGVAPETDRDNYMFKRVAISGALLADIYKDFYNTFRVATRSKIDNEYNFSGWAETTGEIVNMITDANKHEFFGRSQHMSTGLVQSLRGKWGIAGRSTDSGIVQDLSRISYIGFLSHLRRVNMPMDTSIKIREPHRLNGSQWGVMCPCESPDGASIGLLKNFALLCHVTYHVDTSVIMQALAPFSFTRFNEVDLINMSGLVNLRINNNWVGCIEEPLRLVRYMRLLRRNGLINPFVSVAWNIPEKDINIQTDRGRCARPLLVVEKNQLRIQQRKAFAAKDASWDLWIVGTLLDNRDQGVYHSGFIDPFEILDTTSLEKVEQALEKHAGAIEFVDVEETNGCMIAMTPADISPAAPRQYTHCEIHPSTIFSVYTATIPLSNHNQAPRNIFSGAQGKQAIGVYATNFSNRIDTMSYVLHYPQKPLITTRYHEYLKTNDLPNGENLIVAIATYSGYNQEDSIIINKASIERGMFNLSYFKSYISEEKEEQNSRYVERISFSNPNEARKEGFDVAIKAFADYTKLDENGMPALDSRIEEGDAVVGKVLERSDYVKEKDVDNKVYVEETLQTTYASKTEIADKTTEGIVDKVVMFKGSDNTRQAKIRLRKIRIPELGDKLASRHGQKGVIGMIMPQEMMPFTKDGVVPDIIVNPHAFPSRMTIGHLIESILAKSCAYAGCGADGTAFENHDYTSMYDMLQNKYKMERHGDEIMYNGITGEQMQSDIFIGPTYYFRLKHMVADKINYRRDGKVVNVTKQPTKGRGNDGGLRIGEMETNVLISHGLSGFMKESMMERSDKQRFNISDSDGQIIHFNKKQQIYPDGVDRIRDVEMPYAFKLFVQEMQTMSIDPRLVVEPIAEEDAAEDFIGDMGEEEEDANFLDLEDDNLEEGGLEKTQNNPLDDE